MTTIETRSTAQPLLAPSYGQLQELVGRLGREVAGLSADLDRAIAGQNALRGQTEELRRELGRLVVERDRLRERVAELERQRALNSRNSSKPPSSDGYRRPARKRREESGRRPGKQPGAPGAHLAQVESPDRVDIYVPVNCTKCGHGLDDAEITGCERRQVMDLPPLRWFTTEHQAEERRCPECGECTRAVFPAGVTASAQYGEQARALATYLVSAQHLPFERASATISEIFGVPMSPGTVCAIVAECGERLLDFDEEVKSLLQAAPAVHFDETGSRVNGKLHWLHSASTEGLTHYSVQEKRGRVGMEGAGVLPHFRGVAVHDCWTPYWAFEVEHAICGAHLLRELDAAATLDGQEWAAGLAGLLVELKDRVEEARGSGTKGLPAKALARYRQEYEGFIQAGQAANPVGVGRRRSKPGALVRRLDEHREEVLRFARDFRVRFDNNQAERDLRMVKLQEKISGGWRSLQGAQNFCRLRGYISTMRKNQQGVLEAIRLVFAGRPQLPALC